jgi:hypothetical protein
LVSAVHSLAISSNWPLLVTRHLVCNWTVLRELPRYWTVFNKLVIIAFSFVDFSVAFAKVVLDTGTSIVMDPVFLSSDIGFLKSFVAKYACFQLM